MKFNLKSIPIYLGLLLFAIAGLISITDKKEKYYNSVMIMMGLGFILLVIGGILAEK